MQIYDGGRWPVVVLIVVGGSLCFYLLSVFGGGASGGRWWNLGGVVSLPGIALGFGCRRFKACMCFWCWLVEACEYAFGGSGLKWKPRGLGIGS